jgi:single-strand DNA-binding protein
MLNQVVFVGKSISIPKFVVDPVTGKESVLIMIEVDRNYKNADGEYEVDIIPVKLWSKMADVAFESALPGALLGVKGCLETAVLPDGQIAISVVGEKVSFLTKAQEQNVER